jgi:LysM repeat protein
VRFAALLLALILILALPSGVLADPRTYTVEPGDSLVSIATRYNTTTAELRRLNNLADADLLRIGQVLVVVPGERVQRISNGQTFLDLANVYGMNAAQIAAANRLANPDLVAVGDELIIPPRPAGGPADAAHRQRIWAPYRSQFDGSPFDQANCGPVALGMLMAAFGEQWSTQSIRQSIIDHSGIDSYDAGSTWEDIAYAAQKRGFSTPGLFDGMGGYKQWTFEDLTARLAEGRPVMVLVRFWSLPGHEEKGWYGDHYIIILGSNANGEVAYHDPAWRSEEGAYRVMSKEQFERAWTRVSVGINHSGMTLSW